ncbi:uncharacterized protein LOC127723068 [Mytilus californianus]|uniref:uncharacterized protein LOC127723068 n=1 Tax=Mytilus californianus TaxID=6549 RepID=UPI00224845FF|nr:uncharacterized protein LOC127723068 [Mytilus californianus]
METEVLILVAAQIISCLAFQKSVVINEPCNEDQQYSLGLNDQLYITVNGDKFFEKACGISLIANDDKFQCSNLCISIASYHIQTCDLRLAIYDTGVWKFGSASPAVLGQCNNQLTRKDWCSTGNQANIRLENTVGTWATMVGKYDFEIIVVSRCSTTQTAAVPYKVSEKESSGPDQNTLILIGAILSCVIICMGMFIMFLVWYIKRQAILSHQSANSLPRSISQGSAVYHAVQETCDGHVPSEPIQVTDKMLTDEDPSHRVWNQPQPTAPPVEEDCSKERPPSYHETCIPPNYENTSPQNRGREIV